VEFTTSSLESQPNGCSDFAHPFALPRSVEHKLRETDFQPPTLKSGKKPENLRPTLPGAQRRSCPPLKRTVILLRLWDFRLKGGWYAWQGSNLRPSVPELHLIMARLCLSMVYGHGHVRFFTVFSKFCSQFVPSSVPSFGSKLILAFNAVSGDSRVRSLASLNRRIIGSGVTF
jgi:hypothetical protein